MLSGNVLGMLVYFFPALLVFFRTYAVVEHRGMERKRYLCFGGGVVLAAAAQAVIQGGGIDRNPVVELFVRPMVEMVFLYVGLNHRTFRQEREAGYYGAGLGLSFGFGDDQRHLVDDRKHFAVHSATEHGLIGQDEAVFVHRDIIGGEDGDDAGGGQGRAGA